MRTFDRVLRISSPVTNPFSKKYARKKFQDIRISLCDTSVAR